MLYRVKSGITIVMYMLVQDVWQAALPEYIRPIFFLANYHVSLT